MNTKLLELSIDERIKLVKDLWDSIAAEQEILRLTDEQRAELDRRLDACEFRAGWPCPRRSPRKSRRLNGAPAQSRCQSPLGFGQAIT